MHPQQKPLNRQAAKNAKKIFHHEDTKKKTKSSVFIRVHLWQK
jgi:hypothetical protein